MRVDGAKLGSCTVLPGVFSEEIEDPIVVVLTTETQKHHKPHDIGRR